MAQSAIENAETIEAPSPLRAAVDSGGERIKQAAKNMVALVESGTPHMSVETRDLLRRRLRAAAAVFFGGFALFLARWFFVEPNPEVVKSDAQWIFAIHAVVTAVMGGMVYLLSQKREMSLPQLRIAELVVFADPAIFFLVISRQKLVLLANLEESPHVPIIVVPWLILIFTYALFIPNNWRRAAWILAPMATAPLLILGIQYAMCSGFQACMAHGEYQGYLTEQSLVMLLAFGTAIYGVHTINALRSEAFAAKQLGQYRLKHKLGAGGMGEVYLAEHQMMKRPCAVKIIRPEKAGDQKLIARFEREVRSTAKLSHWNSIDIYDYGVAADGTFYYVMEYLPGHDVGELVEGYGPLPASRAIYLMDQFCRALAEAHDQGLVHRDIKPGNLFCAYRGGEFDVGKLLDFGLAKPTYESGDATLTQEGAITGSPLFMSPEQATGEHEADARTDVYSLGAVLYYLTTGRPPFDYKQSVKVIIAHASEEVRPPRELNPDLPIELEDIILRCLEKDADHRFQDVRTLRRALLDVDLAEPWSSEQAAAWWSCHGCPERKAMSAAAIAAAADGAACEWPAASPSGKKAVAVH